MLAAVPITILYPGTEGFFILSIIVPLRGEFTQNKAAVLAAGALWELGKTFVQLVAV